jgi:hypothetical protein
MNPSSINNDEEPEGIKVKIKTFTPRERACPKLD